MATFGAAQYQHVGFAQLLEREAGESWAMFGTWNTSNTLFARTNNDGVVDNESIAGDWLGAPHLYRIDWIASSIDYHIDNALVHSQAVAIGAGMRPLPSDFNVGGPGAQVDWLHMGPYATADTFTSRVFDAGEAVSWETVSWQSDLPAGTTLEVIVRSGDTATPDGDWAAFQPLPGSGSAVNDIACYIQYQAS